MKTRTDSRGRVWAYCDAEGCYEYKGAVIGMGFRNGSKWTDWTKPHSEEFATLKEAMESVGYLREREDV